MDPPPPFARANTHLSKHTFSFIFSRCTRYQGFAEALPEDLVSPEARAEFEDVRQYRQGVASNFRPADAGGWKGEGSGAGGAPAASAAADGVHGHDTVGAVAMDAQGNIAAVSSSFSSPLLFLSTSISGARFLILHLCLPAHYASRSHFLSILYVGGTGDEHRGHHHENGGARG